jgi:2',3'-cyclic-nucleotide 2'-phosphodiesterase (5'-nucleotidase family)
MIDYLIAEKKPHPLSGMQITLDKNKAFKSVSINSDVLDLNKVYYVATSDYLVNGGDNMNFFLKNNQLFDLDYKIRNILIDYFKAVEVVEASSKPRIIVDQN